MQHAEWTCSVSCLKGKGTLHFYDNHRVLLMTEDQTVAVFECLKCDKQNECSKDHLSFCSINGPHIVGPQGTTIYSTELYKKFLGDVSPKAVWSVPSTENVEVAPSDNRPACCENCMFYPCEFAFKYRVFSADHELNILLNDFRSYSEEKTKPCTFMPRQGLLQSTIVVGAELDLELTGIECGDKRVSEGIGTKYQVELDPKSKLPRREYELQEISEGRDKWTAQQPVFIWAPTSRGKNHFIEHEILPYVKKLNRENGTGYKVLIFSNRLALKAQIKAHLNGKEDERDLYDFGEFADVATYQSLLKLASYFYRKQQNKLDRYLYVICDEAHFFTSDAQFNPETDKILRAIDGIFRNAVRVYMSATPKECLYWILFTEVDSIKLREGVTHRLEMLEYHFKGNYDYLDLKRFQDFDETFLQHIANSVADQSERWLIFIDDKNEIERVAKKLREHLDGRVQKPDDVVKTLSSEKKNSKLFENIVKDEELPGNTQVLLTTSVLDNGVNIKYVNNIVVSDMDQVECLQQVGRARVVSEDEHKTLYLKQFTKQDVELRRKDIERRQAAYYRFDKAFNREDFDPQQVSFFFDKQYQGNKADWELSKSLFRRKNNYQNILEPEFEDNEIARLLTKTKEAELKRISLDMESEEEAGMEVGEAYLRYQASWFGKDELPSMDWVDSVDQVALVHEGETNAIDAYFEKLVAEGCQIVKNVDETETGNFISRIDFQNQLAALWKKVFDENMNPNQGNRELGMPAINTALERRNINFRLEAKNPTKGPWKIVRC